MKGACIKRIDQFIVDRLIQMGYRRVKQDIYFHGLFVEGGNIWQTDMPFKPWNPDGEIWKDCKMFSNEDVDGFLKAAEELIGQDIVLYDMCPYCEEEVELTSTGLQPCPRCGLHFKPSIEAIKAYYTEEEQ